MTYTQHDHLNTPTEPRTRGSAGLLRRCTTGGIALVAAAFLGLTALGGCDDKGTTKRDTGVVTDTGASGDKGAGADGTAKTDGTTKTDGTAKTDGTTKTDGTVKADGAAKDGAAKDAKKSDT